MNMNILGIETSCDETAVAIVRAQSDNFDIAFQALASQVKTHARFGGVVPEVAAREHVSALLTLLESSPLSKNGQGIDVIAVTSGPGLVSALRVGVEAAKTLAWIWNKPLVAVNHLEGHIYSAWLQKPIPKFPALCLLVSGGHTELILMKDHGDYEILGMTRDDAAGEAFDKVAKLLGLSYPGGPQIAMVSQQGDPTAVNFPRPMLNSGDFDFSFSGLKTAVRNSITPSLHHSMTPSDIAASFQQAVIDTLVSKTIRALENTQARSVVLCGGVSANRLLRDTLASAVHDRATFHAPDLSFTGDNAVMIALAGAFRFNAGETVDALTLEADPSLLLS
jgi:N6-L-threonylcarbamoyladenine synthase